MGRLAALRGEGKVILKTLIQRGIRLGWRLALLGLAVLPLLAQPQLAAADPAKPADTFPIYLPLVRGPIRGITGAITIGGVPAAPFGNEIRLLLCKPSCYGASIISTVQTDNQGKYLFTDVPSLLPNQNYQVQYAGNANGYLASWSTPMLTSYLSNTLVTMETFDVAGINHLAPADGASITLPYDFKWAPRPATPQDHYSVAFNGSVQFNGADVGYAGSYTLQSLPGGAPIGPTHSYFWTVAISWPDGSIGYQFSVDASQVFFNNSGAAWTRDRFLSPAISRLGGR